MSELFLKILNMSIAAGWLILAVVLLRLVLKKAPKWICVLLWGLVAIRLICPFSFESILSLIPSAETVSPEIMTAAKPEIHTGISVLNSAVNPVISRSFAPEPTASANPLQIWTAVAAVVWAAGMAAMVIYMAVSYLLVHRRVNTAVRRKDNIYQSENVESPFVLGVIRPRIYLPFAIGEEELSYVVAHEQTHIRRGDHLWKPFGFLLLTVYWFSPLMWLAYILLCRDIEFACDEKVIREMDSDAKADYSQALVACSVHRRRIAACPLAFGEVGVKARVRSVLNYKKPAFWIILIAFISCAVVAVCFLTDPKSDEKTEPTATAQETPTVVNTYTTDLKTYYELSDGTWKADGRIYQYRLAVTGRMHNAASDSTFVYLSNRKTITFEQAWRAAGLSSNSEVYFSPDEAVLVDWIQENAGSGSEENEDVNLPQEPQNSADHAIAQAISEHHKKDDPDGMISTASYMILDQETVSGTPSVGQTVPVREEIYYVYYLHMRFTVHENRLEEHEGSYGAAVLVFTVDQNEGYVLERFLDPKSSADYDETLFERFVEAAEILADNREDYSVRLLDNCWKTATDYLENLNVQSGSVPETQTYSPVIDSISYDIDGDGKAEMCTMTYGPTSGLFSFCLYASPVEIIGAGAKYSETYVLSGAYRLSFEITADNTLRIKGESYGETGDAVYFEPEVRDGRIVLVTDNGELLFNTFH